MSKWIWHTITVDTIQDEEPINMNVVFRNLQDTYALIEIIGLSDKGELILKVAHED